MLAIAFLPVIYKKSIGQMSFMSYLIALSTLLFVGTLVVEMLVSDVRFEIGGLATKPYGIINSISVIGMSCFYHTNVFAIYTSMRQRSVNSFLLVGTSIQSLVCAGITISVGIIGLKRFGDTMQDNILMNLATIPSTLSIVLRFVFSIFVATMIPYSFFPLKQACLVIIDETMNKSIS
jgi:amino acid permease